MESCKLFFEVFYGPSANRQIQVLYNCLHGAATTEYDPKAMLGEHSKSAGRVGQRVCSVLLALNRKTIPLAAYRPAARLNDPDSETSIHSLKRARVSSCRAGNGRATRQRHPCAGFFYPGGIPSVIG
jgi:hypothetical protein